jgi:hypothetical protein
MKYRGGMQPNSAARRDAPKGRADARGTIQRRGPMRGNGATRHDATTQHA